MSAYMDKVVWITGGGSGIGAAMALEFARQGADVAVSGRRAEKLAEVVAGVERLGRRALAVSCDVTQEASVEAAVPPARSINPRILPSCEAIAA